MSLVLPPRLWNMLQECADYGLLGKKGKHLEKEIDVFVIFTRTVENQLRNWLPFVLDVEIIVGDIDALLQVWIYQNIR